MIHRHLTHRRHTLAALDDLLENGTLADWRPVLARVRREPDGEVATRILTLIDRRDYQETGALWSAFIAKARAERRPTRPLTDPPGAGSGPAVALRGSCPQHRVRAGGLVDEVQHGLAVAPGLAADDLVGRVVVPRRAAARAGTART